MAVDTTPERSLSDLLSSSRAIEATTGMRLRLCLACRGGWW